MNETQRPTPNSARAVRAYPVAPEPLLAAFRGAVERLPRWTLQSSGQNEVKAVRATRLLHFRDDVTVRVHADGEHAAAELTSASRIGKGDLGQNPRNLKELLRAVDRETADRDGPAPRS